MTELDGSHLNRATITSRAKDQRVRRADDGAAGLGGPAMEVSSRDVGGGLRLSIHVRHRPTHAHLTWFMESTLLCRSNSITMMTGIERQSPFGSKSYFPTRAR